MKTYLFAAVAVLSCIFVGCDQNARVRNETSQSVLDSIPPSGLTSDTVMLVKTGAIHFKVIDVQQTAADVSALTQKVGGMVLKNWQEFKPKATKHLQKSRDSILKISAHIPEVTMTVRVPVASLEEFILGVSAFGYYTERITLDIDDKSIVYLEHMMRQTNRTEVISEPGKSSSKQASDVQRIYIGDESIGHYIENRRIAGDAAFSTVSLYFFQSPVIRRETEANTDLDIFTMPSSHRFSEAFVSGAAYFLDFLVTILHLWVFIFVGLVIFFMVRYYRRKLSLK